MQSRVTRRNVCSLLDAIIIVAHVCVGTQCYFRSVSTAMSYLRWNEQLGTGLAFGGLNFMSSKTWYRENNEHTTGANIFYTPEAIHTILARIGNFTQLLECGSEERDPAMVQLLSFNGESIIERAYPANPFCPCFQENPVFRSSCVAVNCCYVFKQVSQVFSLAEKLFSLHFGIFYAPKITPLRLFYLALQRMGKAL